MKSPNQKTINFGPTDNFLERLTQEAQFQAQLHQHRVLPTQLDWLTSIIGRYPWQALALVSGLTAIGWRWGV